MAYLRAIPACFDPCRWRANGVRVENMTLDGAGQVLSVYYGGDPAKEHDLFCYATVLLKTAPKGRSEQ